MNQIRLDELLQGISNAIIKANHQIREQYIKSLQDYFDDSGKAKMVDFNVPYDANSPEEYLKVSLPKLTLVPLHSMIMKEIKFDFAVPLSHLILDVDESKSNEETTSLDVCTHVTQNMADQLVQIQITMKDYDTPEGVIKLNEKLCNYIP